MNETVDSILQILDRFCNTHHDVLDTIIEYFKIHGHIGFMELVNTIGKNKGYISKILKELENWSLITRDGRRPQIILPNIHFLGQI